MRVGDKFVTLSEVEAQSLKVLFSQHSISRRDSECSEERAK